MADQQGSEGRFVGEYLYRRYMLLFKISRGELIRRLPEGWLPLEHEDGSNIAVGFCEVFHTVGATSEGLLNARRYFVPINGNARNERSGAVANFRYVTFADGPDPFTPCDVRDTQVTHDAEISQRGDGRTVREVFRYTGGVDELTSATS